jgi:hypothetical protein
MSGEATDLRGAFQDSLNRAIARGQRPSRWLGLGDGTCEAIEAVAYEHPDATAAQIANAYDSFAREHGAAVDPANRPTQSPARPVARRDRFDAT